MCCGNIVKVFHEDNGIEAFKVQDLNGWSANLSKMETDKWYLAKPQLIGIGGGPVYHRGYRSKPSRDWGYYTKSIKHFCINCTQADLDSINRSNHSSNIKISGWYAWNTLEEAISWSSRAVYRILLRGIIYATDIGELSGSEMKILERL